MTTQSSRSGLRYALAGAAAFVAAQAALFLLRGGSSSATDGPGWFLNSGTSLLVVAVALAVVSAALTARSPAASPWRGTAAFAAGAAAAMTLVLFIIGPGTIFPIVLFMGAVIIVVAAVAGAAAGIGVRRLRRSA